jgi:hypothetical protein
LLGAAPAMLIGYSLYASRSHAVKLRHASMPALLFSLLVGLLGPVLYRITSVTRGRERDVTVEAAGD